MSVKRVQQKPILSAESVGSIAVCAKCYAYTDDKCVRTKMLQKKCVENNNFYFVEKPIAEQFVDTLFSALQLDPDMTQKLIDDGLITRNTKQ